MFQEVVIISLFLLLNIHNIFDNNDVTDSGQFKALSLIIPLLVQRLKIQNTLHQGRDDFLTTQ